MKVGDRLVCKKIAPYIDTRNMGPFTINKTYIIAQIDNKYLYVHNDRDILWSFDFSERDIIDGGSNKYYYQEYFIELKEIRRLKLKQIEHESR